MSQAGSVQSADNRRNQDSELLRCMRRGDQQAFSDLYDRLSRPLYSIALRILNNQSEAEDVVQEVLLTLWEKAGSFNVHRGSPFSWAVTLARKRAIERLRNRNSRDTLVGESPSSEFPRVDANTETHSANDSCFEKESSVVRAALVALPPDQLRVLELAYFNGLTLQEIAARVSEPAGSVRSRIRRGLLKLRDLLTRRHD